MASYKDERDGTVVWRYRKRVQLPNGRTVRISGTPEINTQRAADDTERDHILRLQHPERFVSYETKEVAALLPASAQSMPTVRVFAERVKKEYAPDGKSSARDSRNSSLDSGVVPYFGHLRLDEITQSHVNAYMLTKPRGMRNKLMALATLLRYAADLGIIPEHKLKLTPRNTAPIDDKQRALTRAEIKSLIKACNDSRHTATVLLGSEAGLRVGEILGLQWADIKADAITVRRSITARNKIESPKWGKTRTVPVSPAIKAALAKVPKRGVYVLTTEDGDHLSYSSFAVSIKRVYKRANVAIVGEVVQSDGKKHPVLAPDVDPFHSLRHTFGTELVAKGIPLPTVQKLMGHADIRTTMRYVTTTSDQMTDAIASTFGASGRRKAR